MLASLSKRCATRALYLALCLVHETALAQTGTFLDRQSPTDLRVFNYNVYFDSILPHRNLAQAEKFARLIAATAPDIVTLQEIYYTPAAEVQALMNTLAPLPAGASWQVSRGGDNLIVSKFPLSLQRSTTNPAGDRAQAIALVDLPDERYPTDLYLMNNHWKCCGDVGGSQDIARQRQADSIAAWLRDARAPGDFVALAPGTAFAVVGDLNLVGSLDPLDTVLTGDISNETTYGPDFMPDWDGTPLADAHPLHNVAGPEDYTWRDDNQQFDPGRLDFVLYSDSVVDIAHQFVLNTATMTPYELAATGLRELDVTLDQVGETYDHLPLVIDFRFFSFAAADFNFSRTVDAADLHVWRNGFGATTGVDRTTGDTDSDGRVDGTDFLFWQRSFELPQHTGMSVPEPTLTGYGVSCLVFLASRSSRRRRLNKIVFPKFSLKRC